MSKSNENNVKTANRNRWMLDNDRIKLFEVKLTDIFGKPVRSTYCDNGDACFAIDGYNGAIEVKARSGRLVSHLTHPAFPRVEDQILFAKRFYSKSSWLAVREELEKQIIVIRDRVANHKAKIEAKQNKLDNNGEMPRPTKTKKPGLPCGIVGGIGADGKLVMTPEYKAKMEAWKKDQQNDQEKEHGKNALGHIKNSMAATLDKLFLHGVTEEELQAAGFTPARYKSHFRHLNTAKVALVEVRFENGKYTAKMIG